MKLKCEETMDFLGTVVRPLHSTGPMPAFTASRHHGTRWTDEALEEAFSEQASDLHAFFGRREGHV